MRFPCTESDATTYTYYEKLIECAIDLEHLSQELRERADAIRPVKAMVREQMDLVANYRNTIIAVLVALYVPISFVCSFADMMVVVPGHEHQPKSGRRVQRRYPEDVDTHLILGNRIPSGFWDDSVSVGARTNIPLDDTIRA